MKHFNALFFLIFLFLASSYVQADSKFTKRSAKIIEVICIDTIVGKDHYSAGTVYYQLSSGTIVFNGFHLVKAYGPIVLEDRDVKQSIKVCESIKSQFENTGKWVDVYISNDRNTSYRFGGVTEGSNKLILPQIQLFDMIF